MNELPCLCPDAAPFVALGGRAHQSDGVAHGAQDNRASLVAAAAGGRRRAHRVLRRVDVAAQARGLHAPQTRLQGHLERVLVYGYSPTAIAGGVVALRGQTGELDGQGGGGGYSHQRHVVLGRRVAGLVVRVDERALGAQLKTSLAAGHAHTEVGQSVA